MSVVTDKSRTNAAGGRSATAQSLTLTDLVKTYASRGRESVTAVKGIDLAIEPGELVALLGPSGCGKTTTLRMIAGLETVTSGSIASVTARSRSCRHPSGASASASRAMRLYPPLSVRENLLYGLKARKVKGAEQMVDSISSRLEMDNMLSLRPAGLSSGQKQRVALARALVRNPPVLLLDEPLSHLDASARQRVRRELKVLQREFGYTTIVVTHDQVEALSLADRLAVMDAGVVQQFGTPDEVFDDPANLFVATFVGEPQINVVPGIARVHGRPGARRNRLGHRIPGHRRDPMWPTARRSPWASVHRTRRCRPARAGAVSLRPWPTSNIYSNSALRQAPSRAAKRAS